MTEETYDPTGIVFILRGLPGVGKTELALLLQSKFSDPERGAVILSSDDFFVNRETLEYIFDMTKVDAAHKWNFKNFKTAIEKKIKTIIIDNSNIKSFHYSHYVDYAQRHNYRVVVALLPHNDASDKELSLRTPHGINRNTIRRMRKDFEWELK